MSTDYGEMERQFSETPQRRHGPRRVRMDGGHRGGEAFRPQRHHRLAKTPAFPFLEGFSSTEARAHPQTTADGRIYENSGSARRLRGRSVWRRLDAPPAGAAPLLRSPRSAAPSRCNASPLRHRLAPATPNRDRDSARASRAQGSTGSRARRPLRPWLPFQLHQDPRKRTTSRPCSPKPRRFRPLANYVLAEIAKAVPGSATTAGAAVCGAVERRANLRRAHHQRQGAPPRDCAQRRRLRGALSGGETSVAARRACRSLTHMAVLTDARRINEALIGRVREAADRVG